MATAKSKKPKATKVQEGRKITLGLKSLLFTIVGFVVVMVWVFVLGVLVGRGDVSRWLQTLGFLKAELVDTNQLPPAASVSAPLTGGMVPTGQVETLSPAPAAKPAPLAASVPEQPKEKSATQNTKKEGLQKPVVKKFPFQNSLDFTPTKQVNVQKSKTVQKAKAVQPGTKPSPSGTQPRVVTKAKPDAAKPAKTAKQPEPPKKRSSVTPRIIKATIAPAPAGEANSQ